MSTTYLDELAEFVAETPAEAIPADVLERTALVVADCLGCMVAGSRAPEVRRLIEHLTAQGDVTGASVAGTEARLDPAQAALVGGTAGTWHDLDEGNLHTRAHAAIQIVPAALAYAESQEIGGRALLESVALAYEVAGRLWRATSARLAVHPHGTYGPLAAALALCRLRALSPAQTRDSMNLAMTLGIAASRQTLADGATVRNLYSGHSGRAGFEALTLRDLGFTPEQDAPASILGHLYGEDFDPKTAVEALGEIWWVRKCYFKRFASGRYAHAALDALEELLLKLDPSLAPNTIEHIDVTTFFMAATMAGQRVETPFGIRFSIPALIARRIVRGVETLTDDGTTAFADERMHRLARRIFVAEDLESTRAYPVRQPTTISIRLRGGRTESASIDVIRGESDNALSSDELKGKFLELTEASLGAMNARQAYQAALSMAQYDNLRDALAPFRRTSD